MNPPSKICGVCQSTFGDGNCIHMPGTGTKEDPYVPTPVLDTDTDNMVSCGPTGFGAFLPPLYADPPACHLYSVLNQAVPYDAHWPLLWDSTRYDTDEMFDKENAPSRITFKTAGLYLVTLIVRWWRPGETVTGDLAAIIRENGDQELTADSFPAAGTSAAYDKHSVSVLKAAGPGEYVEALVYHSIVDSDTTPRSMRISVERYSPIFSAMLMRPIAGMNIPGIPESA